MVVKKNQSAILAKYFSMYKKNPRSRVFAPLAESFRKLGMMDDAMKILREGIKHHPSYTLGYIVLAHCYYDQQRFDLTYNTLRPIVAQNADNFSLQKIFAQSCVNLGHLDEALETYKYLLFMSPKDKNIAEQVRRLEDDLMIGHKKLTADQIVKAPDLSLAPATQEEDWVQVNFTDFKPEYNTPAMEIEDLSDSWKMEKPDFSENPILKKFDIPPRSLDDDFYADEFAEEGDIEEANESITTESPIISHTLIDLYLAQKYFDKATELLEKILELNPEDEPSRAKLIQVRLMKQESKPDLKVMTEDESHDELISIIETQVKAKSVVETKIQHAFEAFAYSLKEKSLQYR
jgi:tetratricopeptide (TPR) repeat protein